MAVNPRISKDSFFDLDFDFDKFEHDYHTTSTDFSTDASIANHFPDYQAPIAGLESPHYASTEMPVPPYSNPIDYTATQIGYMAADEMFPMPEMNLPDEWSMLTGGNYSQEEFCDLFNPQPNIPGTATTQQQVNHSAASDLEVSNITTQAEAHSTGAAIPDFYGLNVQAISPPQSLVPSIAGSLFNSPDPSPSSATVELPPTPDSTSFDTRKCGSSVEDKGVLQQELLGDGSTYEEFFNLAQEKQADAVGVAPVDERTCQAALDDKDLGASWTHDKAYSSTLEVDTRFVSTDLFNAREGRVVDGDEVSVEDLTFAKSDSLTAKSKSDSTELPPPSPPKPIATNEDEIWDKDIAAMFSAEYFQQVPAHNYSDSNTSTWSHPVANLASEPLSDEQLSFTEDFGMPLDHQYSAAITQAFDQGAGYNAAAGSLSGQNLASNSFTNARPDDQYTAQPMQWYGQDVPQASEPWSYAPMDNSTDISQTITATPQQRLHATPKKPSSKLVQPLDQAGKRVQSTAASTRQDLAQRQQTMRNTHPSLMTSRKRKQDELVAAARSDQAKHAATPMHKRARTVPAARNAITHTNARGTSVSMPGKPCPQPAHSTGSVMRRIGQTAMATILGHAAKNGGFIPMKNGRLARVKMTSDRDIHFHVLSAEDTARVKMERMETRARELRDGIQQVIDPAECFKQMQSGDGWLR